MFYRGLAGALILFATVLMPHARSQEQPDALLRAQAGFTVVVDAVVTDKRNRMVTDLSASDLVVYEDEVAQEIDTFQLYLPDVLPPASTPEKKQPAEMGPTGERKVEATRRRNLIIFLLDFATTEFVNQKLVQEACEKYVRENLGPDDYVAVFSLSSGFQFLQDFTSDKERLLAVLGERDISGRALAASGPSVTPPGSSATLDPNPGLVSAAPGTPAAGQQAQALGSQQADLMLAERIQQLYYTMTSFVAKREAYAVMGAIRAISRGVEEVEGRKTLILFSQGFVVGSHMEAELEKTVGVANRANVSIYGIDSQGLAARDLSGELVPAGELGSISSAQGRGRIRAVGGESLFDRARQVGSDVRDSSLRYVSGATGGFAIRNTNDLHLSMRKIDDDIRSYYLLTYRPKNQEFDGRFRQIRVDVKREGLTVRSRSGYLALPPGLDMVSGDEFRLLTDVRAGKEEAGLPAYFSVSRFYTTTHEVEALLNLEIYPGEIRFEERLENDQPAYVASIGILGLILDERGKPLTRFGTPVNLHLTAGEYEVLKKGSLSFVNRVTLLPGMYTFEVIVRDEVAGRTGRVERALMVDPLPEGKLALSSIVLGKEVEKAREGVEAITFGDTSILPSAAAAFKAGERLVYYFDIYGPDRQPGVKVQAFDVKISVARIGSSIGAELPEYRVTPQEDSSISTSRYIELDNLIPGKYFFNVQVKEADSGESVVARTPFEIVG